jgi:HPt (histidine-containing phosphotransfer) domain-containing protein
MLIKIIDKTLGIEVKAEEEELIKEENHIFDFHHLDKVSIGDAGFQKEIISTFINDVNQRLQRAESYLDQNEIPKLITEIHTIKGASYSIGARKMGDEALAIEISAKHNDYESTAIRFKKLQDAYRETKEVVKDYLIPV